MTRPGRRASTTPPWDPNAVSAPTRDEVFPFTAAGVVLGFFSLLVCYSKGYLLLYGDAVAHLGIARRIVDAHYPGIAQLGGVWLAASASADAAVHRQYADVADGLCCGADVVVELRAERCGCVAAWGGG